ncbi:MAG TPA: hypothetical protein DCS93_15080 [Microscillaceae bacterium]|nr:hypothetical protein [Microscillaceae bacterium]
MTQQQSPKEGNDASIEPSKIKTKSFTCRLLGHDWEVDSMKRTCTRCGKTQILRFTTNIWVDC